MTFSKLFFCSALLFTHSFSLAALTPESISLHTIQSQWAKINYQWEDEQQEKGFTRLMEQAKSFSRRQPEKAEGLIWLGIIQSSAAGAKGGLRALSLAKDARQSFEDAMKIDSTALSGSAYTSLGMLYHKVPGWPIGFGSDKTARKLLQKGLVINPDGIDSNYFYAEFLYDKRQYKQAKKYLLQAKQAPSRPLRPLADSSRQMEIDQLMEKINKKL